MPSFYYFDINSHSYIKHLGDVQSHKKHGMKLHDCHEWIDRDGNLLEEFIKEIEQIHYKNLDILEKYNLHAHLDFVPNKEQSKEIFEEISSKIVENDIISIYGYRGCGQYYVYNDGEQLRITSHAEEYGRSYPPESVDYFFENDLDKLFKNNKLNAYYDKIDVFYDFHRKKYLPIGSKKYRTRDDNDNLTICIGGIYIDTETHLVISSCGKQICGHRYLCILFDDYDDYVDEGNKVDRITIINKKTKKKYFVECVYFEYDDKY